jgi:hypothetical protein
MIHRTSIVIAAAIMLLAATSGTIIAQDASPAGLDPKLVAKGTGFSGLKWIGGNSESPLMNPGQNCMDCHAKVGGPRFVSAGTVYAKFDEKDNDFGVEAATVQLTDAKGAVTTMVTNKAGNFHSGRGAVIAMPYTAKILFNGKERKMSSMKMTANCMQCHSAKGNGGAPGRVVAP